MTVQRTLTRMPARVLIVDDHEVFRSRARKLLELAGYDVVGESVDAAGAVADARRLKPDVVLLDVQLPDADGFSVVAELTLGERPPQVVLISSREAADYGSRLDETTAAGFIHKPELSRSSFERLVGASE